MIARVRGARVRARGLAFFAVAAMLGTVLVAGMSTRAHTGAWIDSTWTTSPPTVDGSMSAGEWSDAASVYLGAIPGNALPAWLLAKNDATFVYIAYDATGDTSTDPGDSASIGFDTDHDAALSPGREDQFFWGGTARNGEEHWVSDGFAWTLEETPFDPTRPNHAGLDAAFGFGTSDRSATPHRIFEIQVPLALLGGAPGDVLGLLGASYPFPGVVDFSTFAYSTWPDFFLGPPPPDRYGDLRLGRAQQPNDLDINPPSQTGRGVPNAVKSYTLNVVNRGGSTDTFDMSISSPWPAVLLDATGTNPLADTDGDLVPDTGPLAPGASAGIVARVNIAGSSGCADGQLTGVSSNDVTVSEVALVRTCLVVAALDPPHSDVAVDTDVPPNTLYDILDIRVGVVVYAYDFYEVDVGLMDQTQSTLITLDYQFAFLAPGTHVVTVRLRGSDIRASGINGPYVAQIDLLDGRYNLLDSGTHMTGPYAFNQFEPPAAAFRPPHSDRGVDTDVPANGLYDVLAIDLGMSVNEAGTFFLFGVLRDGFGSGISYQVLRTSLDVGDQTVRLGFLGRDIQRFGSNGPYTALIELWGPSGDSLGSTSHTTAAYSSSQFDPPGALFLPPHGDRGVDLDVPPDGWFEFLEVDASVSVQEAGRFTVSAYLLDASGFFIIAAAAASAELSSGSQIMPVRFNGADIRTRAIDGPYTVELYLEDSAGPLDFGWHQTAAYSVWDFSPPGAQLAPPYSDTLVDDDTPPDGLADFLEVDAEVQVTRPGTYLLQGVLVAFDGSILGTADGCGSLPVGRNTCSLRFAGDMISALGANGPYGAYMGLFDDFGRLIGADFHYTKPYLASDFEPADTTRPASSTTATTYFRNTSPMGIPFGASDPSPTEGLASVTLWYRHSSDNATWGAWTSFVTVPVSGSTATGSISFGFANGPGYYEFQTTARDLSGNEESVGVAESRVLYRPLATLRFFPNVVLPTAGQQIPMSVRAYGPDGQPAAVESPLTVSLSTESPNGEFRQAGTSTRVTSVVIPAGEGDVAFDYFDTRAGSWQLRASSAKTSDGIGEAEVANGPASTVAIDPPTATLSVGDSLQFTARAADAFGNPTPAAFTWSAEAALGSISSDGLLTAATTVSAGTVTVAVVGSPSVTASAGVTLVSGPAARVVVDPSSASVAVDGTQAFTARVEDAYGNAIAGATVAWSVTDGIGTVSATGGFTADTHVGSGRVVATYASLQGFSAVVLEPGPPANVLISPESASVRWGSSVDLHAQVFDEHGNAISDVPFVWSVTGPGTLSSTAGTTVRLNITGEGTVTVTVTAGAASGTATFTAFDLGMSPGVTTGIGLGAVAAGIAVGFVIGWALRRRRGGATKGASTEPEDQL